MTIPQVGLPAWIGHGALVVLLACLATRAPAGPCPGISPEMAQSLFDRMKAVSVSDAYRFEGVFTDEAGMVVRWSLHGEVCPPLQVVVENCESMFGLASLRLDVPPELLARCPGLAPVVQALSSAVAAEHPVGHGTSIPAAAMLPLTAIAALVLVSRLLTRRLLMAPTARRFGWRDVGWVAFAVAAATPFFFNASLAVSAELGAAWIVFTILLFDRHLLAAANRAETLSLFGLFVFSLLLRWWLSSGGPGDLHLNLAAIWSSEVELRWGPAPIALFRLLALVLGGIQDTQILWCNLILSSLLPILLYGIVAELGVGKVAALLAAVVAAAHPYLIAFSGVLERQPTYLFAAFGSTLALIGFLRRGQSGRFIAFVLGALLATTSRPEGAQVLILYLAVVLLVPASRRARAAVALALMLMVPVAFAYVHYVVFNPGSKPFMAGAFPFLETILFNRDFTPFAWIVAFALGLVLGARQRAAWVAVVTLLGFDIAWRWTGMYRMFVGVERQVASARYEALLLVPFVIGVALLIQAALRARPWVKVSVLAVFVVLTAATYRPSYETLLRPFTVDHEYRFLKRIAVTLPPQSRLYILDPPLDDIGFLDAHLIGPFAGSAVRFGLWSERQCDELQRDGAPTYLYIGSACAGLIDLPGHPLRPEAYAGWMQDCASIRARAGGDAVEEIDVPGRKMSWHDFRDRTVRLGVYRLRDASLCALGPRRARS